MSTLFLFAALFIAVQAVNPNESKTPSEDCKEEIQNGMHYTSDGVPYNNNKKCIKACEMKKKAKMNNDGRKNRQEALYLLSIAYKDKTLEEKSNSLYTYSNEEKRKANCEFEEEYNQLIVQMTNDATTAISNICQEEINQGMHSTSDGVLYNNNKKCIKACEMKKKAKIDNDGQKNRQNALYLLSIAYKDKTVEEKRKAIDECSKKEKGKGDCEMEEECCQRIAQMTNDATTAISNICQEEIKQGMHSTSDGVRYNNNKKCIEACEMKKVYQLNNDVDKTKDNILKLLDAAYKDVEHKMKITVLTQCYEKEEGMDNCETEADFYECITEIIFSARKKIEKSCKEEIIKGMHSTSDGVLYNNNKKCIEACILKKRKVMNEEGVLLVDNIYQNLGNMFKGQELDEMKGTAKKCVSKVKELGVCETAFQYQQCIKEKLY